MVQQFRRTQLLSLNIAYTYDCHRILKHVLNPTTFFVTYMTVVSKL